MDLPWGDERSRKFLTNVGLITSDGPNGPNVMAAEWTHHVSYSPGLIAVCLGSGKATLENIRKTKEFGVSLAAVGQNVAASVAGGYTGREKDKIAALKELGLGFYKAKEISVLMMEGASMNAECRLVKELQLGDHTMLVGEVLSAAASEKDSMGYYKGLYVRATPVEKPSQAERDRISRTVEKHGR